MIMIAKKVTIYYIVTLAALLTSGCSHNIHVKVWGFASPCGAVGYGSFSCVKDNVTVERTEEPSASGVKTINKFTVGKQTTGYDVELSKSK
jgi:hypothetical protein